jgi:hypothetical protein
MPSSVPLALSKEHCQNAKREVYQSCAGAKEGREGEGHQERYAVLFDSEDFYISCSVLADVYPALPGEITTSDHIQMYLAVSLNDLVLTASCTIGKAEAASRRNEKLARRNPDRLQKQLDDLKAIESSGGKLTSHEQKILEELERDLKAVRRAREALGDKAPAFESRARGGRDGERGGGGGVLGKRRRDGDEMESDESDIPDDVKSIPMPRDTPPPIPKEILDKWYQARRERHGYGAGGRGGQGTNANNTPLGETSRFRTDSREGSNTEGLPSRPVVEVKTVYEAAPVIRDLRKEAVSAFVPAAVRTKMQKAKGVGGLVEPEEADRLEKEGYLGTGTGEAGGQQELRSARDPRAVMVEDIEDEDD